jgi:short subunit dehydrogenase-like uncharacterized protein
MKNDFLLYGSYGYSGDLVARQALQAGLRPLLAGRDPDRLARQAGELGLDCTPFSLDETFALESALSQAPVVLHAAGPYKYTAAPMVAACLRTGRHYLDLTGEIAVFAAVARQDEAAKQAGVMLLPGAGFDVAATDCLALYLKERLPTATHLALAFSNRGPARPSHGTLKSGVEGLGAGVFVRQDGKVIPAPDPTKTRQIDLGYGPVRMGLFPWGDVFTAYYSTGIPNIEDYTSMGRSLGRLIALSRSMGWLFRMPMVKAVLRRAIESMPPGPTPEQRQQTTCYLWGEVRDGQENVHTARLQGPEAGYAWTPIIAVAVVQKVLSGIAPPGYQTPAKAFGADFILGCGGQRREDIS